MLGPARLDPAGRRALDAGATDIQSGQGTAGRTLPSFHNSAPKRALHQLILRCLLKKY
jgi:hypothetical protein